MKAGKPDAEDETSIETEQSPRPCLSAALTGDLTAHRTAALRAVLADRPEVALAAVVHALALPVFYADHDQSGLAIHAASPLLRAEGIEYCLASRVLAERHAAWVAQLPGEETALWDWLRTQEPTTLTKLLAYCAACTVKPERGDPTGQLAAAVALDMAQWWEPAASD
jgi:ParB family transcriptional regulator, chromosome partitioning protein